MGQTEPAYLNASDQPNLKLMASWFATAEGEIGEKVAAIFLRLARSTRHRKWKGCGFGAQIGARAEFTGPPVRASADTISRSALRLYTRQNPHTASPRRFMRQRCHD